MNEHVPCPYCLELPPLDKARKGKMNRCPLCKTEILETSSGASYRLRTDDGEEIHVPEHAGWGKWISSLFAGSSVILIVVGWLAWRELRSPEGPPRKADTQPLAAAPPRAEEPETPPEWLGCAKSEFPPVFFLAKPAIHAKGTLKNLGVQRVSAASKPANGAGAGEAKAFEPAKELALFNFEDVKDAPPPLKTLTVRSIANLEEMLAAVPELSLASTAKEKKTKGIDQAKAIAEENNKEVDGFIKRLKENRADLAGLPFLMSPDCNLSSDKGAALQAGSRLVRDTLDTARRYDERQRLAKPPIPSSSTQPETFWRAWAPDWTEVTRGLPNGRERVRLNGTPKDLTLPALSQIADGEDDGLGSGMIEYLRNIEGPASARLLVKRALFAVNADVRLAAVMALKERPKADYSQELLDGLKHPWSPAAEKAATTLIFLNRKDLVPDLVNLLAAPDPAAPFMQKENGKKVLVIREMVRINHHANCFLCHAPSFKGEGAAVALVPDPSRPLPTTSRDYYQSRSGEPAIRADITYLRQDFSVKLPVANPGKWPDMQRFDFVVRTRPMTPEEKLAWASRSQQGDAVQPSPQRQALLFALRELTGRDAGTSPEAWRRFVPAAPVERTWKSPCAK